MAATVDDPCRRMLLVASFAISSYSSSYFRAGHKPFNPLLRRWACHYAFMYSQFVVILISTILFVGETFECDRRDDLGFRFLAEQISHHPPISTCNAQAKNYLFYQGDLLPFDYSRLDLQLINLY